MISITLPWGSQSRQPGSKDIRQQQNITKRFFVTTADVIEAESPKTA